MEEVGIDLGLDFLAPIEDNDPSFKEALIPSDAPTSEVATGEDATESDNIPASGTSEPESAKPDKEAATEEGGLEPVIDISSQVQAYIEQGILPEGFEVPEGTLPTDLPYIMRDAWEESANKRAEEVLDDLVGKATDDSKAAMRFLASGGDIRDFYAELEAKNGILTASHDISTLEGQRKLLTAFMRDKDFGSDQVIEEYVQDLEDKDQLEDRTRAIYQKLKDSENTTAERLANERAQERKNRDSEIRAQRADLQRSILKMEEAAGGLKLSPTDRVANSKYLLDPIGPQGSQFNLDIKEAMQDPAKLVFIANLLRTNFNLSPLDKKAETKAATKVIKTIQKDNAAESSDMAFTAEDFLDAIN